MEKLATGLLFLALIAATSNAKADSEVSVGFPDLAADGSSVHVVATRHTDTDLNGFIQADGDNIICRATFIFWDSNIRSYPTMTFNGAIAEGNSKVSFITAKEPPNLPVSGRVRLALRSKSAGTDGCMLNAVVWLCGKKTEAGSRDCHEKQAGGVDQTTDHP